MSDPQLFPHGEPPAAAQPNLGPCVHCEGEQFDGFICESCGRHHHVSVDGSCCWSTWETIAPVVAKPFTENEIKDVLTSLYQDGHVDLVLADRIAALMQVAPATVLSDTDLMERVERMIADTAHQMTLGTPMEREFFRGWNAAYHNVRNMLKEHSVAPAAALSPTKLELNAWRELGEEMGRVISLMPAETFADWFPDWFGPRLFDLQVGAKASAPLSPAAQENKS